MSTEFFNDQWRIPSNENQSKVSNYSMEFDGTSDKIEFGDVNGFERTDKFSGSCWVYLTGGSINEYIISKQDDTTRKGYVFYVNSTRKLGVIISRDSSINIAQVLTTSNMPNNTWTHIAFTYDGSSTRAGIKLYINGVLQTLNYYGDANITGSIVDATLPFQISGRDGVATNAVNGKIDQVSIFDYELSQDQVTQLGAEGYAFNFIPNNYISAGAGLGNSLGTYTGDASVSLWFKADTTTSNDGLFSMTPFNGSAFGNLRININNNVLFFVSSALVAWKSIPFTDTTSWHHLVCIFKSGDITNSKIYLDGLDQTTTNTGTFPSSLSMTGKKTIIGGYYRTSNTFDGELSNVSFFNTGLSQSQVTTLYNSGKPLPDMSSFTSLQGWWKLDDTATFNSSTSVWTITDDSSNSNNGSSFGMNASNLVASNINGELITNPMATSPKPIAYYQLGDQSVSTGPTSDYLVPNNSLSDYVFDFDGTTDYITAGTSIPNLYSGDITFSTWVYFRNFSTSEYFLDTGPVSGTYSGVFMGALQTSGNLLVSRSVAGVTNSSTSVIASGVLTTGKWHHIVGVYDTDGYLGTTAQFKVYVDGQLVGTANGSGSPTTQGYELYIGKIGLNNNRNLNGLMSNVSFFNTPLSSPDIQTLYNNGAPNDISSLSPTAWYKLNAADTFNSSTSTWTINDYGSGGNDGTSSGMNSSNLVVSDLQQTSGYSPYALSLDGTDDFLNAGSASYLNGLSEFSLSFWINLPTATSDKYIVSDWNYNSSPFGHFALGTRIVSGSYYGLNLFIKQPSDVGQNSAQIGTLLLENTWHNVTYSYNSGTVTCYLNGSPVTVTVNGTLPTTLTSQDGNLNIGKFGGTVTRFLPAKLSNIALWGTELTQANATEIYNQGRPSNLHNFSGTAPLVWWQLGSNSSYNSGAWTCLDEIGTNNAVSAGSMTNDDIVDGPGYSANGLGTSSIDIVGDAPYSTANGLSENMDVLDRTTDVPS